VWQQVFNLLIRHDGDLVTTNRRRFQPPSTLSLGYRVVGVGNFAQADGQWPSGISSPASISGINGGLSTIIHGGFAGSEGRS